MTKTDTTKSPIDETDDQKPDRSIPDTIAVTLDDIATQDDADLALILGLDDTDPEPEDDDEPA